MRAVRSSILRGDTVCNTSNVGIAIRDSAADTQLTNNSVRCGGKVALELSPGVTRTIASSNTLADAHIGILIETAPGVRLVGNHIDSNSVFGSISVRGESPDVEGSGNVVSGRGIRSLDVQQGAPEPVITNTDVSGFSHQARVTAVNYFEFHPILLVWGAILVAVIFASAIARLRRRRRDPGTLYAHSEAVELPGPARRLRWPTRTARQRHRVGASAAEHATLPVPARRRRCDCRTHPSRRMRSRRSAPRPRVCLPPSV